MTIGGFQKFSLLDYPGKLTAIVFTQGCNFRCPYCHNPELVDPRKFQESILEQEILDFLKSRKGLLGAVAVTGGEPTIQSGLIGFLQKLKAMDFAVKLDTNGSLPEVVAEIIALDLVDYWAMDLKAPLDLYQIVSQSLVSTDDILRSMSLIRNSGKLFEFRTTIFEKILTWNDLDRIKTMLQPGDTYYLQQCRYNDTLADLSTPEPLPGIGFNLHLEDDPAGQDIVAWGDAHQISIRLRSL